MAKRRKTGNQTAMDELKIEEIAKFSNVIGSDSGFIASDNLDSDTYLNRDYISSISGFKVGSPFKIRFTMMLFCLHGEMEVQLNLVRHTLHAGEMLLVHEETVAMGLRMDPTIRLFIMGFSRKFVNSLPPSRLVGVVLGRLLENPIIRLDDTEMADILAIYRVINSRLAKPDFGFKSELVWAGLHAIGSIVSDSMKGAHSSELRLSRKQIIVKEFIRLVGEYASLQRDIPFYARQLCISPKYLGQVVAEATGETPRKWICRQVVLEAKALLDDPTLTVQQVSEALNFANQSFFGTFFRQHTGVSPRDYRTRK